MEGVFYTLARFAAALLLSPWFWLAVALLLLWWVLTLLYRRCKLRALERLQYDRALSADGMFVGEKMELTERVCNPTWFPLFSVKVEFFMPSGVTVDGLRCQEYTKLTSVFHIPPFSKVTKTHTLEAFRRDRYKLESATVEYRKTEFLFQVPLHFYAYPNRFDADAGLAPDLYHAGNAISDRKYLEDPFFLSGIRPYQGGDPMRAVNFKATVRSFSGGVRRLMCNQYDSSRNYDSMIFLDLTVYKEIPLGTVEQTEIGLRCACFLFCEALKNGGRVGFCSNCTVDSSPYIHIPCGSGDLHAKSILERFACISSFAGRDYSMSALLQRVAPTLPAGTDVYLITPMVDFKTGSLLRALERGGVNVQTVPLIQGARPAAGGAS